MALYYDLPVFKDVCRPIIKLFEYIKDFPKEYKYTLGQDIKRDVIFEGLMGLSESAHKIIVKTAIY